METPSSFVLEDVTVRGVATDAQFAIAPIRQVVYLHYQTSYVEGLRDFGLRAVDAKIRDRVLAVCKDTYKGVNIDFRDAPPTDFALFENVELVGVDPNDMGLFGYDNSPGKDSGNERHSLIHGLEKTSRGAATSISRMCWIMCTQKSWALRPSIGESSATNRMATEA